MHISGRHRPRTRQRDIVVPASRAYSLKKMTTGVFLYKEIEKKNPVYKDA